MKTIVITLNGKELTRFVPFRRSTLVGRSPSCDVVMRSKQVKPVHFLVEWLGEGEFNPNEGLWTIIDLAQKPTTERDVGEGLVLSSETVKANQFEFKIVEDELAESQLRRGVLSRNLEEIREKDVIAQGNAHIAEVIYFRKDIEAVVNVKHFDRRLNSFIVFPSMPRVRFTWPQQMPGIGFLENQGEQKEFKAFNRGQNVTKILDESGKKLEIRSTDLVTIETDEYEYYVRLVPPVRVDFVPLAWLKDSVVRSILLLLLLIAVLGTWMAMRPEEAKDDTMEPPRIATVEVEEKVAPPPPPAPEPQEIEVPPMAAPPKEVITEAKKPEPKGGLPAPKVAARESRAAAPTVKNVSSKVKNTAGLNSPAPIKDVNTVGLLAKLKGGGKKGGTVSADQITNKGVVTDTASGDTGFVVSQPPAGVLGRGRTGGGSANDSDGLVSASTTLRNSGVVDENSVGAIGMKGGKGKFSSGFKLSGGERVSGSGSGLSGGDGSMDVAGGLTKEQVRRAINENRRAISSCYETALLARKDLEGRLTLRWKITPQGPVESIVVQASTINMPSFENCVLRVVRGIIFPKAPNKLPTTVIYPFVFQGKR